MRGHPLIPKARDLRAAAERFSALPAAQTLALRLDRSLALMEDETLTRPVAIALFGGTQVGKSTLFNALVGREDASPVSDGRGCFTQDPVAAVHPADEGRLPWLEELRAERVGGPLSDVVLVDTADIDGVEGERQVRTRRVMDHADVLVYVTSPDKRSNFDVLREVRARVTRKRWFFVMTRADQVGQETFEDFRRGVEDLGFDTGPHCCFLVDARAPEAHDLPRLRTQIFSARPVQQLRALREEAVLSDLIHALDPAHAGDLSLLARRIEETERDLDVQVRSLFAEVLDQPDSRQQLQRLTRYAVWRAVSPRVWPPLKLAAWLRARSASLPLYYSLGRMATAGPNVFRLLSSTVQAVWARNSVAVPMEALGRCFSPAHMERLEQLRSQARRSLEDLDLDDLDPPEPEPQDSGEHALANLPVVGRALQAWSEQQAARRRSSRQQLLDALQGAIEVAAENLADRAVRWRHNVFGNLLPALFLLHGLFRLFRDWFEGTWLSFDFFIHFLLLFLATLIPGYWLLAASVRRVTGQGTDIDPLGQLREPAETRPLREARRGLERLAVQADRLERRARQSRDTISRELAPETFGARAK